VRDYTVINLDGGGQEQLLIPPFQRTLGTERKWPLTGRGYPLSSKSAADLKGFPVH